MLSCKDISLLLSKSCNQDLVWQERWAVRLHLLYCRACRRVGKQLRFMHAAARRLAQPQTLPEHVRLSAAARQRIRDAVRRG